MPIFTKCNFDAPSVVWTKNNPVNLSVCCTVFKSSNFFEDGVIFPSITFLTENKTYEWIFESEQDRDSEFKRIMSI